MSQRIFIVASIALCLAVGGCEHEPSISNTAESSDAAKSLRIYSITVEPSNSQVYSLLEKARRGDKGSWQKFAELIKDGMVPKKEVSEAELRLAGVTFSISDVASNRILAREAESNESSVDCQSTLGPSSAEVSACLSGRPTGWCGPYSLYWCGNVYGGGYIDVTGGRGSVYEVRWWFWLWQYQPPGPFTVYELAATGLSFFAAYEKSASYSVRGSSVTYFVGSDAWMRDLRDNREYSFAARATYYDPGPTVWRDTATAVQ